MNFIQCTHNASDFPHSTRARLLGDPDVCFSANTYRFKALFFRLFVFYRRINTHTNHQSLSYYIFFGFSHSR